MEEDAQRERLSWLTIASSKPFRFVVGSEQRQFTVSSALIAHQSPTLRTLVNGDSFLEAQTRRATLEWVDENTFTRFIQYAYTGDYDATNDGAVVAPVDHPPESAEVQEPEPVTGFTVNKRRRPATEKQRPEAPKIQRLEKTWGGITQQQTEFWYNDHRMYNMITGSERKSLWSRFIRAANPFNKDSFTFSADPEKDCAQIFLCHAKMYVFADYYGISHLRDLSQNKLGQVLLLLTTNMKFRGQRLTEFVALVRYCYEEPAPEALQSFVTMYAAYHANMLWKDAGFQDLAEEHGELSFAFVKEIMPMYINASEGVSPEESSSLDGATTPNPLFSRFAGRRRPAVIFGDSRR